MRVSIILYIFGSGGVAHAAANLAKGFAARGIETELLVCAEGGPAEDKLRAVIGKNVSVHYFVPTSGVRLWDLLKGFTKMGHYLLETKPKVVLSAGNNVNSFSALLVRLYCPESTQLFVKITNPVVTPHHNFLEKLIRNLCYAFIFRHCDGVLSLSKEQSKILRNSFPYASDKIVAANNPLIPDTFSPRTTRLADRTKDFPRHLIAVGRLDRQKRFDVLFHAFTKVKNDVDCRLVILGEGKDRTKLQTLSIQLGIAHLIQMPGFVSDVPDWLTWADLFILSSDYEGLPGVVLEALAVNCPVVSTDCFPCARALLGTAPRCSVTPIGDADALASAIYVSLNQTDNTMELSHLTTKYRVSAAVDNHIDALNLLIHQAQAGIVR